MALITVTVFLTNPGNFACHLFHGESPLIDRRRSASVDIIDKIINYTVTVLFSISGLQEFDVQI